ncbi:hypothetical protein [Tibeticola sp.]|uniref:hypothetical protein n=1 Tax=Tibeticola sp. TaxID=2005368 RepID=UPI0025F062F6|nr:hypothetical protein [Tibeticola sp.]
MKPASRAPSGAPLAFWLAVFLACSGLTWGSATLLFSAFALTALSLGLWLLR